MTVAGNRVLAALANNNHTVRPASLMAALPHITGKISVLSLDCFDTILWRRTALPSDVFIRLQTEPTFAALGFSAALRSKAEAKARKIKFIRNRSSEVTLREIYLAGFPQLSDEEITELTNEEMAVEREVCYAFAPMVHFMRAAIERGIKMVIVSDTYFTVEQLTGLLHAALPLDLAMAIDQVFCSSEYGRSKEQGLFAQVVKELNLPPSSILHIGDRLMADCRAPREVNIPSLHFQQEEEKIADIMRLQALSAMLFDPSLRTQKPWYQPLRHYFAMESFSTAESIIGYFSLGTIMYAFAAFICSEVEKLRQSGKTVQVVFVLRDGYLPALACEILHGSALGKPIRLSRFTAYAAGFRSTADIDHYLSEMLPSQRFADMTKQLLLPEKVAEPILRVTERSMDRCAEFARLMHRADIVKIILHKSAEYRQRLIQHVRAETGIKSGETLLLVDLGYSGTVQNQISPLFAEVGIEVIGRYLIALPVFGGQDNRRGLLDCADVELTALNALVGHIAILEQLCTCDERSVIDFDKEGRPVFSTREMGKKQQQKLAAVQKECLRFLADVKAAHSGPSIPIPLAQLQTNAMAELARMIYMPTKMELAYLQDFQFDINLGTDQILSLSDKEKALTGLHRRGLFFIEKDTPAMRMNYPAELREVGFELALTYMIQQRFNLDIKLKDTLPRRETISVMLRRGQETHQTAVEALATYDGYYSLWTPIGKGDIEVLLKIGKLHEWFQIESAEIIGLHAFVAQQDSVDSHDAWSCLTFMSVTERDTRIFQCLSAESQIGMVPKVGDKEKEYIFRLVYRPIKQRES